MEQKEYFGPNGKSGWYAVGEQPEGWTIEPQDATEGDVLPGDGDPGLKNWDPDSEVEEGMDLDGDNQ